jgi:flavin-dependent dehydrogenase
MSGLRTVLFEQQEFPQQRPGEALHPGVEVIFRQLQVIDEIFRAGFFRYSGIRVTWGSETQFEPFGSSQTEQWLGFSAWRPDLDRILLNRAVCAGVRVLQPCAAFEPITVHSRVSGVKSSAGTIHARFVIDGTGSRHWLARCLYLPIRRHSPRLVATYGYCAGEIPGFGLEPLLHGDASGWMWIAQVRPLLYSWIRLNFHQVNLVPPKICERLQPRSKTKGADVTWRLLDACAGDGYYVIGDAESVLDPAASNGVLKALMSGIYTADLIEKTLTGKIQEKAAAAAYRSWSRRRFVLKAKQLLESYTKLQSASSLESLHST